MKVLYHSKKYSVRNNSTQGPSGMKNQESIFFCGGYITFAVRMANLLAIDPKLHLDGYGANFKAK